MTINFHYQGDDKTKAMKDEKKGHCPTPHNSALPSDFADTVLMPGDPLRSRWIASEFLSGAKLVNDVRGVAGYTGTYKGVPVSVMASGMGIPSIMIYSYELYNFYGVSNIIRVGTAGSINHAVRIHDIVLAISASTDSAVISNLGLPGTFAPTASYELLSAAKEAAFTTAGAAAAKVHIGSVLSSDMYYGVGGIEAMKKWADMGVLAVEMEAAGLYVAAARAKKRALAICTVSNDIMTGEETTSGERERGFSRMVEIALKTAYTMYGKKE